MRALKRPHTPAQNRGDTTMCPACVSTWGGLLVAGGASTGGLAALVVALRAKSVARSLFRSRDRAPEGSTEAVSGSPQDEPRQNKEKEMKLPKVASREEWLRARKALLVKEKEWSRQHAALTA